MALPGFRGDPRRTKRTTSSCGQPVSFAGIPLNNGMIIKSKLILLVFWWGLLLLNYNGRKPFRPDPPKGDRNHGLQQMSAAFVPKAPKCVSTGNQNHLKYQPRHYCIQGLPGKRGWCSLTIFFALRAGCFGALQRIAPVRIFPPKHAQRT